MGAIKIWKAVVYYPILPETLISLRSRLGWSQEKLATEAGVERRTIIKKERSVGPAQTRDFIALRIAGALGIDVSDLFRPIPEEVFFLDVDVFSHLKHSLEYADHYHAKKILDYITYHLAEALDAAQLDLNPDWQKTALEGPKPRFPSTPTTPSSLGYASKDEEAFRNLLAIWHQTFGDLPVNPDRVLREPRYEAFHLAVQMLPVVEHGRINHFWFKAYLRRNAFTVRGEYTLRKIPNFDAELWSVDVMAG